MLQFLKAWFALLLLFFTLCQAQPVPVASAIKDMLSGMPADAFYSILVVNPLTEDTVFAYNQFSSLIPASTTKLFTSAAALYLLGPDFKVNTTFFSDDRQTSDGVINGNLYLKGYGNSAFTTDDLQQMIKELRRKGIRHVSGNVYADDTYFDSDYSREDWIEGEEEQIQIPPVSALVVDKNRVQVRKKIRRRRYKMVWQNLSNPPASIATRLHTLLEKSGITVDGMGKPGETPAGAQPLVIHSMPLIQLIKQVNKRSDNFMAECLFKTIGAAKSGSQGNAYDASVAVHEFVDEADVYMEGTRIVDGSGLSRLNQMTVASITDLLKFIYVDLKKFDHFYNSLSIAGIDGTLRNRLKGTFGEDNFHGKTGTLKGSSSVAGYLKTRQGDDLIISMIFEYRSLSSSYYKGIQDKIIAYLAEGK